MGDKIPWGGTSTPISMGIPILTPLGDEGVFGCPLFRHRFLKGKLKCMYVYMLMEAGNVTSASETSKTDIG
jgi:hypothetical protein